MLLAHNCFYESRALLTADKYTNGALCEIAFVVLFVDVLLSLLLNEAIKVGNAGHDCLSLFFLSVLVISR